MLAGPSCQAKHVNFYLRAFNFRPSIHPSGIAYTEYAVRNGMAQSKFPINTLFNACDNMRTCTCCWYREFDVVQAIVSY